MNPEPDHDLRARFSAQRRADQEHAPAWHPRVLQAASKASEFRLPCWLPITAAACLLLSLTLLQRSETPDLVAALPVLFEEPDEPLFASLDNTSANPSDFLLPTYLTIQLP
jgi:hypothetical protein